MNITDLTPETEGTFLRCLHDERPDDPRVATLRRERYEALCGQGLRARLLVDDAGDIVGMCQYIPIEHSHLRGEKLMAILCIWVHGYDHLVGNQQGQGYGRLLLDAIEAEARAAGLLGVAAWGMDFPDWNPVSFYEHMGYTRVDQEEMAVLVWKAFDASATSPAFHRQRRELVARGDRIPVHLFLCGWCTGACSTCVTTREALEGLDEVVAYEEIDTLDPDTLRTWGISDGLYVDCKPYRPDEPPHTAEQLRQDLLRLARDRGLRISSDS